MTKSKSNQFLNYHHCKKMIILPFLIILFASCQRNVDSKGARDRLLTDPMFTQYILTLHEIENIRFNTITLDLKNTKHYKRQDRAILSSADKKSKFLEMANSTKNEKKESYNQLLIRSIYLYTKLQIKYVNKIGMSKEDFKNLFIEKLTIRTRGNKQVPF